MKDKASSRERAENTKNNREIERNKMYKLEIGLKDLQVNSH